MLWLIVGLVTFLGFHSVSIFAPAWRDSMVARLGALNWRGLYSVVSIASFLVLSMAAVSRGRSRWSSTSRRSGCATSRCC